MGRVRQLKSVLRHYVLVTTANGEFFWSASRNWIKVICAWKDVLLFRDKDEADRFLIQRRLSSGDGLWQNAEVRGEWLNL
jgi:hypothetical protein